MITDGLPIRILIVADDPLSRAGLASMLVAQTSCEIVGQIAALADWPAEIDTFRPDAVLWDMGWDASPDVLEGIAEYFGDPEQTYPVLALIPDPQLAQAAWSAGVQGLMLRDLDGERLASGLWSRAQGLVVLDPLLAEELFLIPAIPDIPPADELTPRELEVLQLMAEGLSNRAIAQKLDISEHTVKFHVNAIFTKLGAQSRTDAVVRATRLGLIIL